MERTRMFKGTYPVQYIVSDKTSHENTILKKLLSHQLTKGDITHYSTKHLISLGNETNLKVVCCLENFVMTVTVCDNMMDAKLILQFVHAST